MNCGNTWTNWERKHNSCKKLSERESLMRKHSIPQLCKNFNPRTPCGVRHAELRRLHHRSHISIHAPHAGCDPEKSDSARAGFEFQSTHPMRGATCHFLIQLFVVSYFNPRTPCGVRHETLQFILDSVTISIHAPHAGCDDILFMAGDLFPPISIHAPHAGCDRAECSHAGQRSISIHAPHAGCDPAAAVSPCRFRYFNPRTPCGVRPRCC